MLKLPRGLVALGLFLVSAGPESRSSQPENAPSAELYLTHVVSCSWTSQDEPLWEHQGEIHIERLINYFSQIQNALPKFLKYI